MKPRLLGVEVWALRQGCGPRIKVTAAQFTFVALDGAGRPRLLTGSAPPESPAE